MDDVAKNIANPFPWIDASSLIKIAEEMYEEIYSMVPKAQILQELGWTLRIDHVGIIGRKNSYTKKSEAIEDLKKAGIPINNVNVMERNYSWDGWEHNDGVHM